MFRRLDGRPARRARAVSAALLSAILLLSGGTPSPAQRIETPPLPAAGFTATIAGAYEGTVSGAGVLKWLAHAGFARQGYFFLADGQGIRPHGVTFILPRGTAPGRYALASPAPLDIGRVASVRVDRDTGSATISADKNTSGFIELERFPADAGAVHGAAVSGRFAFATEDAEGRRITVEGAFSFRVK